MTLIFTLQYTYMLSLYRNELSRLKDSSLYSEEVTVWNFPFLWMSCENAKALNSIEVCISVTRSLITTFSITKSSLIMGFSDTRSWLLTMSFSVTRSSIPSKWAISRDNHLKWAPVSRDHQFHRNEQGHEIITYIELQYHKIINSIEMSSVTRP